MKGKRGMAGKNKRRKQSNRNSVNKNVSIADLMSLYDSRPLPSVQQKKSPKDDKRKKQRIKKHTPKTVPQNAEDSIDEFEDNSEQLLDLYCVDEDGQSRVANVVKSSPDNQTSDGK